MKKAYKDLEMETVKFEAEDVITASGGDDCDFNPDCTEYCNDAAACTHGCKKY